MEENKTTRVNRTVNYYSDRPDYDRHMEKHNFHCERPNYDHCPEKPEYDQYPERPHYDHCPERPEYDHHTVRPNYNHYPVRPGYDHHPVRPNHDHYPVRPPYDCYEERPNHDCYNEKPICDSCQEKSKQQTCCCTDTNLCSNECNKCCSPLQLKCPDINCAICTPIIAQRIFDFKCIDKKLSRQTPEVTFNVALRPNCPAYTPDAQVCIEKISASYTCLGFSATEKPLDIDSQDVTLDAVDPPLSCATDAELFNRYSATLTPEFLCCNKGKNANFVQTIPASSLNITNLVLTVEGFIGCEPFRATFANPAGTQPFYPLFLDTDVYGNLCLPKSNESLDLTSNFNLKYLVKCIVPTSIFTAAPTATTAGTFTARVYDLISLNEKLYVAKPDELVVYSTPNGLNHTEE